MHAGNDENCRNLCQGRQLAGRDSNLGLSFKYESKSGAHRKSCILCFMTHTLPVFSGRENFSSNNLSSQLGANSSIHKIL